MSEASLPSSGEFKRVLLQVGIQLNLAMDEFWKILAKMPDATSPSPGGAAPATGAGSLKPLRDLYLEAWDKQKPIHELINEKLAGDHETHVQVQLRARREAAAAPAKQAAVKPARGRGRAKKTSSKPGVCGKPGHAIYGGIVCAKCQSEGKPPIGAYFQGEPFGRSESLPRSRKRSGKF